MGSIFVSPEPDGPSVSLKEHWVPVLEYNSDFGDKIALEIGDGEFNFIPFSIPDDFGTLVSAHLECMPIGDAADEERQIELTADYGTVGDRDKTFFEEEFVEVDFSDLEEIRTRLDVSPVLTQVRPRHNGSIKVDHLETGDPVYYFGFRLLYQPA